MLGNHQRRDELLKGKQSLYSTIQAMVFRNFYCASDIQVFRIKLANKFVYTVKPSKSGDCFMNYLKCTFLYPSMVLSSPIGQLIKLC